MPSRQDWEKIDWLRLRTPWDEQIQVLAQALGLEVLSREQRRAMITFASEVATRAERNGKESERNFLRGKGEG